MRYISMFSGIEAASAAWRPLDWEPMAFAEIEPFPCAVLAERFPDVPNLGDVCDIDWKEFVAENGRPDVIVGGSPCQSFSVAGGRESLSGESRLCFEYVRAVRETKPDWFLWENVPGVLNTKDNAFGQFLCALWDCGYHDLSWRVLDAQFFGVAQRRRRVYLVGHLGDGLRSAAVLFERDSLRGDHPSSREKRQELAAHAGRGAAGCGGECLTPWGFSYKASAGAGSIGFDREIAPSLLAGRNDAACIYAISGNVIGREDSNGGHHLGVVDPNENSMFTLTSADRHVVAFTASPEVEQTTYICMADGNANAGIAENVASTLKCGGSAPIMSDGYVVRRLTPMECERLQGFPDGWTKVPYRSKAADECPDTPRYKALGNSMAVPVMRWIGGRISMIEEIEADLTAKG